MGNRQKVVILGGGFAGIAAAKQLTKSVKLGMAEVTIVDRNISQTYTPLLYEVATAYMDRDSLGEQQQVRSGVSIPLSAVAEHVGAKIIQGEVVAIDWEKHTVMLRDGEQINYDYLVIAFGSESTHFGIPGVKDYAVSLKSVRDAEMIRQKVHDLLYKTEKQPGRLLRIVLAGGGPSGVELASELVMMLRRHIKAGHLEKESVSVTLVEGKPRLLSMLKPHISSWALERLRDLGVVVHRDACVKEAKLGEVVLTPRPLKAGERTEDLVCDFRHESEMTIPAELFIWTAGVRGSSVLGSLGLKTDPGGRVVSDPTLELKEHKNVFVVGDAAIALNPETHEPVPWTAQGAMTEGTVVGRTIRKRIAGNNDSLRVPFLKYPTVVTVGGKWAVVELGPVSFRGFLGWVARKVADLDYFAQVLPFGHAFESWRRGIKVFGGNDK